MFKLLLTLIINSQPIITTIDYNSSNACENAKTELSLAYTPNTKQSTSEQTIDVSGYQMFKNANVTFVSAVCNDLSTGSVF